MSWSISKPDIPASEVRKFIEGLTLPEDSYARENKERQFDLAKKAALTFLDSYYASTNDDGVYSLSMVGHANPTGGPTGGYTDWESIGVTLGRRPKRAGE